MPFTFEKCHMDGLIMVRRKIFKDERGYFTETYKEGDFTPAGINRAFKQENLSFSRKGVIRGLHYQLNPYAQGKLVSVISGKIMDVALDLRRDSKGFGKYFSIVLSEDNATSLWIPEGFAHGFCALEDSFVLYRTTSEYNPERERGIRYDDPQIGIEWPDLERIVSKKDRSYPLLSDAVSRGDVF